MRNVPGCVLLMLLPFAQPAWAEASQPATASPEAAEREMVVRFTRAYGMAQQALEQHADDAPSAEEREARLRDPDALERELRQEIYRIMDLNGLDRKDWRLMFTRMDEDEEFRDRVESLSVPFGLQQ
jgi:hypothetical protein